jgi:heptosyltransferase I
VRVGIVLLTGIGDVVHGLPVANALKRDDPGTRILWVAEPAPAEVLRHHPAVDEVVVFRKSRGVSGVFSLRNDLRDRSCQLALNMQRYGKSLFPLLLMGAGRRIGLPPSKTRDGISFFHTEHLPEGPWRHTQDLFLEFLDALEIPREPVEWRITLSREEERAQRTFFRELGGRPVAGMVLATANRHKDWPAERYVALAEALEGMGYRVLLLGGPGERERTAAQLVLELADADPISTLGDSVRRLIWLVQGSDLVVSPDTGPLHIAHALDVPVVGLFGHSNPWRVGPWRRFRDLVVDRYTDPGAEPDPSGYEPKDGRMERIAVDDVLERVERARERYGAGTRKALA